MHDIVQYHQSLQVRGLCYGCFKGAHFLIINHLTQGNYNYRHSVESVHHKHANQSVIQYYSARLLQDKHGRCIFTLH